MTVGAQLMRENAAVMAAGGDTRYAIAWHGTPHVWPPEPGFPHGRPRLDKMGTGEGSQAYGWGWYSAEARDVAASYKNYLSEPKIVDAIEGTTFDRHSFAGEETIRNGMIDGLSNDRIAEKLLDLAARAERIGEVS